MNRSRNKKRKTGWKLSISEMFVVLSMLMVLVSSVSGIFIFERIYKEDMEQSAVTSSEQTIVQVQNTLENYTSEIEMTLDLIKDNLDTPNENDFMQNLVEVRTDIVAITAYDDDGTLLQCWTAGRELKEEPLTNLSYEAYTDKEGGLNISRPHVESIFVDSYPWVVTIYEHVEDEDGRTRHIALDIRFSNIANYIDDVGIGQRGYCFLTDLNGDIVYHPQQQLINAGLRSERTGNLADGTHIGSEAIYTVHTMERAGWKIIGVCYVDEMITQQVASAVQRLSVMIVGVLFVTFLFGWLFSRLFSSPAKKLAKAMEDFEKDAENFEYSVGGGTSEIMTLSESFGHMVLRIQSLMEKVRKEEVSLRKTELKALQAQINPHFLYNTLDAIAWLCEDGQNKEAEEMVTALANLFRISISKGHELIPIAKEVQHAQSYLKIEKIRYKDQFTYHFDIDESCLGYLCNKITLQPIIENAIYHGINRMVDEGRIEIRIFQKNDDIIFQIEDNGVGMTEEQCREILQKESGDRTGIGIKNVNDRIRIYFGEEYGLSIASELDEGTCVTIRMPKITEGKYEK